jgi:adenylate cyclase
MFSQFVNECFEATSHAIQSEEGLLNKFTGDGVMALFNVPLAQKYYALCAVKSALKIRDAHAKVMNKWHKHGLALRLGIGLCSGNALVGLYGSKNRFEYTAMGTTVNRAARIQEKAAREPDQEILICENTYKLVAKFVKVGNKMAIEGKKDEKPIIVYPLISLR